MLCKTKTSHRYGRCVFAVPLRLLRFHGFGLPGKEYPKSTITSIVIRIVIRKRYDTRFIGEKLNPGSGLNPRGRCIRSVLSRELQRTDSRCFGALSAPGPILLYKEAASLTSSSTLHSGQCIITWYARFVHPFCNTLSNRHALHAPCLQGKVFHRASGTFSKHTQQ